MLAVRTNVPFRDWVIARIEEMLERIVDGLLEESDQLTVTLKSRSNATRRTNPSQDLERPPSPKSKDITFPGGTVQEAWRFTVVVRVLELVHGCLVDNTVMTKRDMYYRHPDLFVKQSVVDRYVDDLACTLGVSRASLNVTAAAKGLVAGNFRIQKSDGALGILVPSISDDDILDLSCVCRVVIIEKEATFRTILQSPHWKIRSSRCILVTAKGYPDIATRHFLRYITDRSPQIPFFALVDFDPDGIAIMSTYKYGSFRLAHENVTAGGAPALNLPELNWLGVQSRQIVRSLVTKHDSYDSAITDAQGLMRLTPRDRKKARCMLEWDLCAEDGPEPAWRQSLQTMLMLNVKAEMQFFEQLPGGLSAWVEEELSVKEREK
ncbi:DNA topoisomerase IV, alpha subunit [Amniculicola lignicola CBS 123094]|uniref:DNA topoisomerase (ATP-hydrolyzing) n=1 Tax=Amniculicola lignicola CBS 123094 TaxID=1392246 RepID=A0A6A5W8X7_9PLEO|nr:DNA topoisomerase IV, alpha subunit [Amniculicola lignicola CBS 123094]